jgi:uncharacterized protein (UPF0335 family)
MSQKKTYNLAELQPDELNELKALVRDYFKRLQHIEDEMKDLREAKADLTEEFKDKLDLRTLNIVVRIIKAEDSVQHRDTFDLYREATEDLARSVRQEG